MIKVAIFRNSDGLIAAFSVGGHANTAPRGQDIVCAAVSALTQTAVLGLEKHLQIPIILDIASGKLNVELDVPPNELTAAILETMLFGLLEIEKINPQNIRISEHRR